MLIKWRNGVFCVGKDVFWGPPRYRAGLYWNRQEDMPQQPPPKNGDRIFMDQIEICWAWPWSRHWRQQ